ncbi:MAG: C39 family peptidase [Gammaproteobacteria bacterium]
MNQRLFFLIFSIIVSIVMTTNSFALNQAALYPTFKNYTITPTTKHRVLLTKYSYQQTTNYTCGPAVVMSLLHYYGMLSTAQMNHATEMRIANEMGATHPEGTSQLDMVRWLENHGFNVNYGKGVTIDMLINNLNQGIPTIVTWNDWNGHALLVVGYQVDGNDDDIIFLADPETTSSVTENQIISPGINALEANDLELNWFNAKYYFNPGHTEIGMYIVAVPRNLNK